MSPHPPFTRRELLKLGVAGGLALAGPASPARAAEQPARRSAAPKPKNIIFMVSDGMSLAVPSLAEPFSELVRGRGTRWYALLQDPDAVVGFFETHALNSLVTDSAAASTAWASGTRVFNGALNVLPDGRELVPLARLVYETGRRVGLVTTTTITHATPAGFAAVQPKRDDEPLIAPQYLDVVDVLLGGGRKFFDPAQRADGRDLAAEYVARGYTPWEHRADLSRAQPPPKVLGLFADRHLPYSIDQQRDATLAQRVPTLAEMTRAALALLGPSERGFLLQVEGGRVDHAAHANDAAAVLWDQLAFDDAIDAALAFAAPRGDTLVVVTSDHGTANPGLSGMGDDYRDSTACFRRVARAKVSYQAALPELRGAARESSVAGVAEVVRRAFGVDLARDEVATLHAALVGDMPDEPSHPQTGVVALLGRLLANHTGIGWIGTAHTQDLVLLTAAGPGADVFAGLLQNTDAFERLTDLLGIRHRNPRMSIQEAEPYLALATPAPPDHRPHWA